MKKTALLLTYLTLMVSPFFINQSIAQGQVDQKTSSPYFFVKSDDPNVDQLPLKSTKANVNIAGVIADVTISQIYKNEGARPLEAIYVFPTSTRAAIYGMKMVVGQRVIEAEIQEKNKARKTYETAKENGQRTSLLEQERPNVFLMNVANIMPGDEIQVVVNYTELLIPDGGVYEFVYPTVVGPRFAGESTQNESFTNTPYLKAGKMPSYEFGLNVWLSGGLPIQDVACTSHKINTKYEGTAAANIDLDATEKNGGNRDFILQYQLAGGKIQEGLLLYEHEDENYFLMMVQPPKKVKAEDIPPREYVFIVDVSGSMNGFPLDISKKLMRNLMTSLRPSDKFNVMLFASTSSVLAQQSLDASAQNVERAINFLGNSSGSGGTRLISALEKALKLPRAEEGISRSFVVITDGYISVEQEAFDLVRNNLDNANLFAFGIGSGVNRHLIEGLAHIGQGQPAIVTDQAGASEAAEKFRHYIQSPVLTRVKASFKDFQVYDMEPAVLPDVMGDRPVVFFGKYKGEASGNIQIKGYSGRKKVKTAFDVGSVKPDKKNAALRYLWARERIRLLDDYNNLRSDEARIREITRLGLGYNLMTAYTSFVAVDKEIIKDKTEETASVKQALPLPQGVPNYAVGFSPAIEGVVIKGINKEIFSSSSVYRFIALIFGAGLIFIGWRKLG
ncbi:MAG: VIT and VWA domain-containing protein [Bacteroidota bacterium]